MYDCGYMHEGYKHVYRGLSSALQQTQVQIPVLTLISGGTGKELHFVKPQCVNLYDRDNNFTYLFWLLLLKYKSF